MINPLYRSNLGVISGRSELGVRGCGDCLIAVAEYYECSATTNRLYIRLSESPPASDVSYLGTCYVYLGTTNVHPRVPGTPGPGVVHASEVSEDTDCCVTPPQPCANCGETTTPMYFDVTLVNCPASGDNDGNCCTPSYAGTSLNPSYCVRQGNVNGTYRVNHIDGCLYRYDDDSTAFDVRDWPTPWSFCPDLDDAYRPHVIVNGLHIGIIAGGFGGTIRVNTGGFTWFNGSLFEWDCTGITVGRYAPTPAFCFAVPGSAYAIITPGGGYVTP